MLAHDTFERALAFVLANRLASTVILPTQLFELILEVLTQDAYVREGALADVVACWERVRGQARLRENGGGVRKARIAPADVGVLASTRVFWRVQPRAIN